MLLSKGTYGRERLLSRHSVETMTTDHLTGAQKAASTFAGDFLEHFGWGFGVAVVTRRVDPAAPVGQYGWDGGLGTSFRADPSEDLIGILMTQQAWTSPRPPDVCVDFWTSVYQAIDD
jgi:CubicO group peptidase (beta-lactamase class C family)